MYIKRNIFTTKSKINHKLNHVETCNCDVFEIAEILFQQSVNFASRQLVRKRSKEESFQK